MTEEVPQNFMASNFEVTSESELTGWLDKLEAQLETLSVEYNQASYNKYLLHSAPSSQKALNHHLNSNLSQYDAAFSALLSEPRYQALVRHWLPRVTDTFLKRRLECLNQAFMEANVNRTPAVYELRNILNDRLLSFQATIDGQKIKRGDVLEIIRTHPQRQQRQMVYETALTPLAVSLSKDVRLLMARRNEAARRLGYPDYASLHLQLNGIDKKALFETFDQLERLTDEPYQAFLKEGAEKFGWKTVEPWDVAWLADQKTTLPDKSFPRAQIMPTVTGFLNDFFGVATSSLPVQVVECEIPFAGLCFSIKIPTDVRILCSPKDGYQSYRTMFHEFGHALHALFNRQTSFVLKREVGTFNEGMAETMAYFCQYSEWLGAFTNLSSAEVARYKRDNIARRIFRFRNLIAQARFEIEAYANLNQNLEKLYAELEARYLMTPFNLTPRWTASAFPITHPVYRQNYILAEMIAAQTHATLQERFGSIFQADEKTRRQIFAFLVENYYAPGALYNWTEKMERATGSSLQPDFLLASLKDA